jgi:hypothetical protein
MLFAVRINGIAHVVVRLDVVVESLCLPVKRKPTRTQTTSRRRGVI